MQCAGVHVSVTAGTIFHRTRTPLRLWFAAAWEMTSQKHGVFALGIQRSLGLGSYQTAWAMLHRYRKAMVRPGREHPVAAERRIVRVDEHGEVLSIRRSPKCGTVVEVFDKLTAFPSLLTHPNLTVEVLLLGEDHIRAAGPVRVRRRTRDPGARHLREVLARIELHGADDVVRALPSLPAQPFSTRELASLLGCSVLLAQRTAYCLRAINIIEAAGKRGHTPLDRRISPAAR